MSYLRGPDVKLTLPRFQANTSVLRLLLEALGNNGDAIAMVEGQTGKTASFADILQQSITVAAGLQSAGITAGDYVVLCCDKSILSYSLLLGVMFTGATAVICPPDKADMIDRLTKGHSVKAILYDAMYSESVRMSVGKIDPLTKLSVSTDLEDLRAVGLLNTSRNCTVHEVSDIHRHVPIIMFSSGTTGEPKGIQVTDVAIQMTELQFVPEVNTLLTASPMYWYSSLFTFVSSMFNKYTMVISNATLASENMKIAEQYQVEGWFVSLGSMIQCINEPNFHIYNLSSVKKVFTGGELTLPSVAKSFVTKLLKGKVTLEVLYGNTECGILSSITVIDDLKLGMCGQVKPGVELKILDEHGTVVALGCVGELWVKSISMTPGYWSRPDLNSALLDSDGFLQSGDSTFFDTSGNLYLRGRIGDLINYRGFKFSTAEAENILMSHPAILDAVVVGKPHPSDSQHAMAFVVKRAGADVSETEIADFVDGQVDDEKRLRGGVHFRESLPRVAVGKVTRKGLRTEN